MRSGLIVWVHPTVWRVPDRVRWEESTRHHKRAAATKADKRAVRCARVRSSGVQPLLGQRQPVVLKEEGPADMTGLARAVLAGLILSVAVGLSACGGDDNGGG